MLRISRLPCAVSAEDPGRPFRLPGRRILPRPGLVTRPGLVPRRRCPPRQKDGRTTGIVQKSSKALKEESRTIASYTKHASSIWSRRWGRRGRRLARQRWLSLSSRIITVHCRKLYQPWCRSHRLQGARSCVLYKPFVSTSGAPFAPDGGPLQLSSSAGIEFPQFVGTCPAMCGSSESRSHLVSSTTSNSQGDPTPPVQLRSSGSSCCACNGCSACYGCCPFCTQSQKVPGLIRSSSQPLLGLPPSGSGYRRLSAGASQSG